MHGISSHEYHRNTKGSNLLALGLMLMNMAFIHSGLLSDQILLKHKLHKELKTTWSVSIPLVNSCYTIGTEEEIKNHCIDDFPPTFSSGGFVILSVKPVVVSD